MELVVDHKSTRGGRWLRRHRLRIALWIAVVEGVLVLFDVIPGWWALVAAIALLALYVLVGRRASNDAIRHVSWIGAVSQLLIAALPVLVGFLTFAAIAVLAIIAVAALVFLFVDRR